MRLLFICDGRSPIAMNWIAYFIDQGDEVHLVSTFDFNTNLEFASVNIVPVAFSQLKNKQSNGDTGDKPKGMLWNSAQVNLRTAVRRIVAPLTVNSASRRLAEIISVLQPDLVHAMRIPFEGILAAKALDKSHQPPLIISVWGNDFTLHADTTNWMRNSTKQVLSKTNGLHTDCQRDQNLAHEWGYAENCPTLVVPGNGGIDTSLFYPNLDESSGGPMKVINPRGIRAYIRNDTFFKAIPLIIEKLPTTKFVCPGMIGQSEARRWVEKLNLSTVVDLLPNIPRLEMADLFREANVTVSPSTHDGTPNTLLEGMACGCFPVAGDLESIREWIEPGINGSLIDPGNHIELAHAVVHALTNLELRKKAAQLNIRLINEKAEFHTSMNKADKFYRTILG
jgi:glycosyltransferase involved in cell wall biosynthesis